MSSIFGRPRAPPQGWMISDGGELIEDPTVAGYVARGREVRGVCHQRDCRRRCDLDLPRHLQRGLGAARVSDLKPLYRCHRLDGCALEFHERDGVEITLSVLAGRNYVGVRIACGRCRKATVLTPEVVIARLQAEGIGGQDTRIVELRTLIRGPCPKCKAKDWRATVLWSDPTQTPTWIRNAGKRPSG